MSLSYRWALAALLAVGAVALAQSPAQIRPAPQEPPALLQPPPPGLNPGDEIYNTLWITDQQAYSGGNGDAWAGRGVWGALYDLQVVDDVLFPDDCCIHELVRDYLTFFGAAPANGAYVALYWMTGERRPEELAFIEVDGVPMEVAYFTDTVFGLVGVRGTVRPGGSLCAPDGSWFVETQPHDESESGDWYYVLRSGTCLNADIFFRDGGRANGGYGCTTWKGTWDFGFGCGTAAMAVRGECDPRTSHCLYEVANVRGLADLCGTVCDVCPHQRGEMVCLGECPDGMADCEATLIGRVMCANGAICRVTLTLQGCDAPPGECRSCP